MFNLIATFTADMDLKLVLANVCAQKCVCVENVSPVCFLWEVYVDVWVVRQPGGFSHRAAHPIKEVTNHPRTIKIDFVYIGSNHCVKRGVARLTLRVPLLFSDLKRCARLLTRLAGSLRCTEG